MNSMIFHGEPPSFLKPNLLAATPRLLAQSQRLLSLLKEVPTIVEDVVDQLIHVLQVETRVNLPSGRLWPVIGELPIENGHIMGKLLKMVISWPLKR